MTPDYSKTPLYHKLGLKANYRCRIQAAPDHYMTLLEGMPEGVRFLQRGKNMDFIQLFAADRKTLETAFPRLIASLTPDGMIWVCLIKKAAKIPTDVKFEDIRLTAFAHGFVDCKVCSIDATWTGYKFVLRKELRK